jgi:hypothetical protein
VVRQWIANPPFPSSNLGAACFYKNLEFFFPNFAKFGKKDESFLKKRYNKLFFSFVEETSYFLGKMIYSKKNTF